MASFYLIDQSLKGSGGHHADYASCVLKSALDLGFENILGCHRKMKDSAIFQSLSNIRPTFRNSVYQKESLLFGLRHLTRAGVLPYPMLAAEQKGWLQKLANWRRCQLFRWRRKKRIREFSIDCERFFSNSIFAPGDHVFLAAVSELELLGLANFLSQQPRTLQVQWHLQFHFNLFEGRPLEYPKQMPVARMVQSDFQFALSRIPYHSLNFYTTSQQLADQFNRLDVAEFESLPYPISSKFDGAARSTSENEIKLQLFEAPC